MAHEIPYVATATVAELRDLEAKVERAMELRGARYLHVLVPCPLGWGSAVAPTVRLARLAKETGIFPVFEARDGEVTGVSQIRRQVAGRGLPAAAAALRPPVRRPVRARRRSRASRPAPTATSRRFGLLAATEEADLMDKPFAITLDVGSSPRQQDRLVAHRAPGLRRTGCRRATTPARPAEDIQGWLYHAEGGDYETAWRRDRARTTRFPAVMGRVCYHPCETACNRGQLDEAVGINSVERFLGDVAIERGWTRAGRGRRRRQAGARRRRRARPGCRPPTTCACSGHEVDDPRRRRRRPAG